MVFTYEAVANKKVKKRGVELLFFNNNDCDLEIIT